MLILLLQRYLLMCFKKNLSFWVNLINLISICQFRNLLQSFSSDLLSKPPRSIYQSSTCLWDKVKASFNWSYHKSTYSFRDSDCSPFQPTFFCSFVWLGHNASYSFWNFFNCWVSPYSDSKDEIACPFAFLNFLRLILLT